LVLKASLAAYTTSSRRQEQPESLKLSTLTYVVRFQYTLFSGSRYFIIFVDDVTRMTRAYFLNSKDAKEVLRVFQAFKAFIEKEANASIFHFGCDNGKGGYDNRLFKNFLSANSISFEPSAPYTQNQNGFSDRAFRTIVEKGRTLLYKLLNA
jgi:hypothetical protein